MPDKKRWTKQCYSKSGPGKDFKIAAFDFETQGLGGKLLYASYMIEGDKNAHGISGDNIIHRLFNFMVNFPDYLWFAHNAQYDWRYMLDYLRTTDYKLQFSLRNDNSIFMVTVIIDEETKIVMRDSYAIWPHTLRELAVSFCPEFPKGNIDFERETFNPAKRSHVAYAKRDVEILVRGLRRFNDIVFDKYGVNLASTVASTALRAWERMLDRKVAYFNPKKHEQFVRDAYFGGLVFLTRNDKLRDLKTYDINSSYPFVMRKYGVPYGAVFSTRFFYDNRPGIYDVTIGAPDNLAVPIIPKRGLRGGVRTVLWPRGIFRTAVTSEELHFALAHGYRLFEIHDGRIWDKIIYPFTDFVNQAEAIRAEFKGKTEERVAKLIQNALYGKTCAKRERRALYHKSELDSVMGCMPWDDDGHYFIKVEHADDLMVLPQWGVWITASARLHLLRTVYDVVGCESVVYGDTDSLTIRGELPTGKAYGDWKFEKHWRHFRAIAPKVYAGQLEGDHGRRLDDGSWQGIGPDGFWTGAAKGIPSKKSGEEIFRELYERGHTEVEISSLPSLMVTMRTGNSNLKVINRKSSDLGNSANWQQEEFGAVRPKYAAG